MRNRNDPPDDRTVQKTAHADAVVTRDVDGEEQDVLRVPISSTRPDRENDEFDREALEAMTDQIREQQPMVFDNHGLAGGFMDAIPYDSRETIGTQFDAEVEEADDGEYDLFAYVNPDGTHPEGERMLKQVRDEGQAIKYSVGFRVHNYDEKTDDAGNEIGRIFTATDLMETSRVGIPANPDASASVMAKGGAGGLPGYSMHPVVQAMQQQQAPANGRTVAKSVAPDGGTKDDGDDGGESCDVDADCPDGKVCVDGECVAEEEADGFGDPGDISVSDALEVLADADLGDEERAAVRSLLPDETDTGLPDESNDADEIAELRSEIEELRGSLEGGTKSPDTADSTDTEPELTDDTDPDETSDDGGDETDDKTTDDTPLIDR